jgi:hypothetical protein
MTTVKRPPSKDRLDKTAYQEQVYAMRGSSEGKWLWAYLIDKMWPYASDPAKRLYRGEVMPAFLSVNKMHAQTSLHEDTIRKRLERLTQSGFIMPFGHTVNAGKYHHQFRYETILLVPPNQCFGSTGTDLYKRMLNDDLTPDGDEYFRVLRQYRSQLDDMLPEMKP